MINPVKSFLTHGPLVSPSPSYEPYVPVATKARFKRPTYRHVPTLMLMRKIYCSHSFTLDSPHMMRPLNRA